MNRLYQLFYKLQELTRQRFVVATEKTPDELFMKLAEYYLFYTCKDGQDCTNFAIRMKNVIDHELRKEMSWQSK